MEDYVTQDIGVIMRGTDLNPLPLLWEYGQVCINELQLNLLVSQKEMYCLDVALSLLKNLSANKRRSAVHVAFAIMSQISPSDDNGIIIIIISLI